MTPLHHAAVQGDMLVIRALVKGKVYCNNRKDTTNMDLYFTVRIHCKYVEKRYIVNYKHYPLSFIV